MARGKFRKALHRRAARPAERPDLAPSQNCDTVRGRQLRIVFWRTAAGGSPVRDFLGSESVDLKKQLGGQLSAAQRDWGERGQLTWDGVSLKPTSSLGFAGEVRVRLGGRQARFFFAIDDEVPAMVVLHAFWKSGESWKRHDAPLAAERWRQYQADPKRHGRP